MVHFEIKNEKKGFLWKLCKPKFLLLLSAGFLSLGLIFGWYGHGLYPKNTGPGVVRIGIKGNKYQLIDPLLTYDITDQSGFIQFRPFEKKVNDLVNQLKAQGKISDVGFYFRGLKTGYWLGINEDNKFSPGSLMKVPLMMAYFKQAESDPAILSKKFFYDGKFDANVAEIFKASDRIEPGKSYTAEELIRYMIVFSDNNAANLLLANVDQGSFGEIFADLGVDIPDLSKGDADFVSPKQYSLFFRILRNATYLNNTFSEKAMGLLTEAGFPQGLSGGVPDGVTIANKFGEYLFHGTDGSQVSQLHDCGMVYYPNRPYFICVMTKGKNYNDLASAIQSISKLVYSEVDANATGAR